MSDTKKPNNPVAAYEVVQAENNMLKLVEGRYALSKEELNNLPGMIINAVGYEIVKDEKTGKILRVKDNRTISEVNDDKHRRLIENKLKELEEKEEDIR